MGNMERKPYDMGISEERRGERLELPVEASKKLEGFDVGDSCELVFKGKIIGIRGDEKERYISLDLSELKSAEYDKKSKKSTVDALKSINRAKKD